MHSLTVARRALIAALATTAVSASGALPLAGLAPLAHAQVALRAECQPDDQECKDKEGNAKQAEKIDEQQKKTQQAADKAGQDIKAANDKLEKCPPGSASCMKELTGEGKQEKEGIEKMTATIDAYRPEPSDNAQQAVDTTCAGFPASLPQGSTDPGRSPFPASRLCSLLGS